MRKKTGLVKGGDRAIKHKATRTTKNTNLNIRTQIVLFCVDQEQDQIRGKISILDSIPQRALLFNFN